MTKTIRVNRLHGRIDFLVITIREDEFEAVLKHFSPRLPVIGGRQGYEYCRLKCPDGRYVNVAVVRAIDQGQSIAQSVAHNAINDLNPKWLVLIGIAGGIADNDFSLGDVLLASSLHDFSITAAIDGESPQLRPSGGPVHPVIARLLAVLPAWRNRLGNWNEDASVGSSRPTVAVPNELTANCYYGSDASRVSVRNSLQSNFLGSPRKPHFRIGAVATANVLLKDTELLSEWRKAARHITHIEMEAGGVYVAARYGADRELPLLCIRGISDIVGFKREPHWTGYACETAASLFHALISELPIEQLTVSTSKPKIALLDAFSALPVAFLRLADGARDLYRLTLDAFRAWASQEQLQTPSLEDIVGAFKKTSQPLLSRAVNPEDRMPRNELVTLREFVSGDSAESVLCVLGSPGTGKTALLAHLAQHAIAENMVTLAIKADTVPVENSFDNWSKSEIGLDVSALDAVRAAAARSEVLVIVDQLDALSGTVDLTSDRLDAVINFIQQCSDMGGVRVSLFMPQF